MLYGGEREARLSGLISVYYCSRQSAQYLFVKVCLQKAVCANICVKGAHFSPRAELIFYFPKGNWHLAAGVNVGGHQITRIRVRPFTLIQLFVPASLMTRTSLQALCKRRLSTEPTCCQSGKMYNKKKKTKSVRRDDRRAAGV